MEHVHTPTVCTTELIIKINGDATEAAAFVSEGNDYLRIFAAPVLADNGSLLCFHCGEALTGIMASLLGKGGFEWGLTHGEGFCAGCKWPARAHHRPRRGGKPGGDELFTLLSFPLMYHPDFVEVSSTAEDAED